MAEYTLLQSQKNDVFRMIKGTEGLDPFNFQWLVTDSTFERELKVSHLRYNGTHFFFKFDFLNGKHYSIFSPGKDQLVERQRPGDWGNQLSYFAYWLIYLKREINSPDLWGELAKYQLPPGEQIGKDIGNEPFTFQQVQQIADSLKKIAQYLETNLRLDAKQKALVNEKLDYLIEGSKRQGKRDWINQAIGVVFTIAVDLALDPEKAKTLWNILKTAISGIFPQLLP